MIKFLLDSIHTPEAPHNELNLFLPRVTEFSLLQVKGEQFPSERCLFLQ